MGSYRVGHDGSDLAAAAYLTYLLKYIMQNAGLAEARFRIKISGRNVNNLKYADNTTLMAGREKELKTLLMKLTEKSEKAGFKVSIQKTKIMTSSSITSSK